MGLLYQKLIRNLSEQQKEELYKFAIEMIEKLYENEVKYIEEIYDQIGMSSEVKRFVRYNGNKALMNLGYETHFPVEPIEQIILNGLEMDGTIDFFSVKSSTYVKAKVENLKDDDFLSLDELVQSSNNRI